jgi:hypothetical protein
MYQLILPLTLCVLLCIFLNIVMVRVYVIIVIILVQYIILSVCVCEQVCAYVLQFLFFYCNCVCIQCVIVQNKNVIEMHYICLEIHVYIILNYVFLQQKFPLKFSFNTTE